ncbi:MAG: ammonium transporter [Candidatus Altiarchaeota archaeon]
MTSKKKTTIGIITILLTIPTVCAANNVDSGDTAWVLASAALVLLMTPAVGFFYGGMVRQKHVLTMLSQSMIIAAVISIQWVIIGYSLSFGPDIGGLIGNLDWIGLNGIGLNPSTAYATTIPQLAFIAFQMMFAIITPALIIGAIADRIKFKSLILFTLLWSTIVYDPLVHWVWGDGGWINTIGAVDFAGGLVVHISAGISALIAAILLGRRIDLDNGSTLHQHDKTMTVLGAALLWFGWFGFNAGSALGANGIAANAFIVTNTAGAAAAVSWMIVSWIHAGKPSTLGIVTGAVAGLATITPASGFVTPMAAIVIGLFTGIVCYLAVVLVKNKTRIDDALDVMACHGVGGIIGTLATGVFATTLVNPDGVNGILSGNFHLFEMQLIAVLAVLVYAGVCTAAILTVLDKLIGLRVDRKEEIIGLDLTQHGEEAYPEYDVPG